MQELLVVEAEGLVTAERRRPGRASTTTSWIAPRAQRTSFGLALARPVWRPRSAEARARPRVLHERGGVDAMPGRHLGVERA